MPTDTNTPEIGSAVYDAAGVQVGYVDDVQAPAFHLNAEKGSGMWLNIELIARVERGSTTLTYAVDDLKAFELEAPAPVRAESPKLDEQMDVFDSPADQAATRREMREGYPEAVSPTLDGSEPDGGRS